jgi:hypothetical protein
MNSVTNNDRGYPAQLVSGQGLEFALVSLWKKVRTRSKKPGGDWGV